MFKSATCRAASPKNVRERSKSLPQNCQQTVGVQQFVEGLQTDSGITCSNNDLKSILCGNVESSANAKDGKKIPPATRRRSLALLYKGFEVCGIVDSCSSDTPAASPSSPLEQSASTAAAKHSETKKAIEVSPPKPLSSISPRKRKPHQTRSLSLVTWDSDAKLSIDPSIIGSSIEAYLAGATDRTLDKLEEKEESETFNTHTPLITIKRSSTKANRMKAEEV